MAPVLNLAKLVRFQRTNQARLDPIYDASLYVFSLKDANEVIRETFPKTIKQFTLAFPSLTHYCFPKLLFFF